MGYVVGRQKVDGACDGKEESGWGMQGRKGLEKARIVGRMELDGEEWAGNKVSETSG